MSSDDERITPDDLLDAMAAADVLETFCHLPRSAQEEFSAWIGKARDTDSHWRRIDALVLAMRSGLLHETQEVEEPTPIHKVAE